MNFQTKRTFKFEFSKNMILIEELKLDLSRNSTHLNSVHPFRFMAQTNSFVLKWVHVTFAVKNYCAS